ncbi:MAG: EMC3/TMCO1 family protein [Methanocellales archaeon]|nr:EMC3/TMCO1 family protein [Methanocellales archaeon]MDD3421075.1 EMC3/TMCO1 family protein [Methanocellales archaeon]MDD4898220.1 EMC3/TMCO1 family protein [Methanocellales archaeon]MDD5446675.1 EMC3/TMCO1 family protein [Methanocellales archaeon]
MSKWKEYLDTFALISAFGLIIGYTSQEFRYSLGTMMNDLLGPLTVLPIHILILVLSAMTGLFVSIIQKYTINWGTTKRIQEQMKVFQKEFREAQLSGNKSKLKKLEGQRAEMMQIQSEMMKQQFKPMAYTMLVTLPLFGWLYHLIFVLQPEATIMLPFYGIKILATDKVLQFMPAWLFWYFICSLSISQVIRKLLNIGV